MFNKLHKVAVSVATSGALVLALGSVLSPTMAFAKDPRMPHVTTSTTQVDPNKPGVIHLVKYDNADHAVNPDGSKSQTIPAGSNPLDGIEFTLRPITKAPGLGDVATAVKSVDNDQLKALAKLTGPQVEGFLGNPGTDWAFGTSKKATTANGGAIEWDDLELGVYLLQETDSVATDGQAYKKAPASLIFLPTTNPTGDGWLTNDDGSKYEVWVYPKNSQDDNLKTVNDANKQVGDNITYTISASVPAVHALTDEQKATAAAAGVTGRTYDLNNFGFWDNLDHHLQLLNTDSVTAKISQKGGNSVSLTSDDFIANVYAGADTDKNAPGTAIAPDTTDGGQKLAVALTSAGLNKVAKAKAANSETLVVFEFSPKVVESGIVPNKAQLYKTNGSTKGLAETAGVKLPFNVPVGTDTFVTNTVVSAWGKLVVTKTDEKETPTLLKGAEFKVYGVNTEGGKDVIDYGTDSVDRALTFGRTKQDGSANPIFVSGDNGQVTIDGLHANNLENSGAAVTGYRKYALVETKAPAGYELSRAPIFFTIDVATSMDKVIADDSWQIDDDGVVTASDLVVAAEVTGFADDTQTADIADAGAWLNRKVTVVNIPVKPRLPLTGGAGIAIFGLLGGGLLLGGLYAAKRNSRQAK